MPSPRNPSALDPVLKGSRSWRPLRSTAFVLLAVSVQMEALRSTPDGERLVTIHNRGCFPGETTVM